MTRLQQAFQDAAFGSVRVERHRQDKKWGTQHHSDERWLAILTEEVGEVAEAILNDRPAARLRDELVQVAAVAVAWIEDMASRDLPGE